MDDKDDMRRLPTPEEKRICDRMIKWSLLSYCLWAFAFVVALTAVVLTVVAKFITATSSFNIARLVILAVSVLIIVAVVINWIYFRKYMQKHKALIEELDYPSDKTDFE